MLMIWCFKKSFFVYLKLFSQIGNFVLYLVDRRVILRVIAKKTLRDFWENHADCKQQLTAWFQETSRSDWKSPADIKREYPGASILPDNRVVFNIKGNNYRLIVKISYTHEMVWVRFVGTHAEYDKINAETI